MGPIEGKLVIMGADIISDVLMDMYFNMEKEGKTEITAEEILAEANRWKDLKAVQVKILEERIAASSKPV